MSSINVIEEFELKRPRYVDGPRPLWHNNISEMHRGDYFRVPIFINLGDKFHIKQYVLRPGDKLYVSIAEPNQPWEHSLIKKVLTRKDFDGRKNVMFKLLPEETEYVMPGKYYIEVKLVLSTGRVYTVFPKRQFWIVE